MAIVAQVALEYGSLTSGNAISNSFGNLINRISGIVAPEYLMIFAGALFVIYLITR